MAEEKEPEVMSAADMQRKVQAGEDPSVKEKDTGSEDVTVTGEDMMEAEDTGADAKEAPESTEDATEKEVDADGTGNQSDESGGAVEGDSADPSGSDASGESGDDRKPDKGKRKKKKEKKDPRDEKIAELNDRLLRNLAEFENFRNRSVSNR